MLRDIASHACAAAMASASLPPLFSRCEQTSPTSTRCGDAAVLFSSARPRSLSGFSGWINVWLGPMVDMDRHAHAPILHGIERESLRKASATKYGWEKPKRSTTDKPSLTPSCCPSRTCVSTAASIYRTAANPFGCNHGRRAPHDSGLCNVKPDQIKMDGYLQRIQTFPFVSDCAELGRDWDWKWIGLEVCVYREWPGNQHTTGLGETMHREKKKKQAAGPGPAGEEIKGEPINALGGLAGWRAVAGDLRDPDGCWAANGGRKGVTVGEFVRQKRTGLEGENLFPPPPPFHQYHVKYVVHTTPKQQYAKYHKCLQNMCTCIAAAIDKPLTVQKLATEESKPAMRSWHSQRHQAKPKPQAGEVGVRGGAV